ncbi:RNA polymerase sigma factor (sigma-70 family) [Catenulispora sp. GAS73]|uniref:sigma-70 family RNA polymerase sigma factor n=1 Tax=Catenulispora sp. GAS73 TaxID=3156269 RepID=UPI003517E60B
MRWPTRERTARETDEDSALVAEARAGDPAALDELIALYLPLVYNIVGRAVARASDVDDIVQETMLRLVRGIRGLRDPSSFRSWLVAVAMNEVRGHYQTRGPLPSGLEELAEVADPGADFADLTLTELGLSGQRREVVEATRWLDPDDRELLSLWWLVVAGHLTRAEMIGAMRLDAHLVTVRVARMKGQLEIARGVVRALALVPGCPQLASVSASWSGEPAPLWRKRFARHIRECEYCVHAAADLVPAERLLVSLSLVPLPLGLAAALAATHRTVSATVAAQGAVHGSRLLAAKLAAVAAATAAVVGTIVILPNLTNNSGQAPITPPRTGIAQAATSAQPSTAPTLPAVTQSTPPTPTLTPTPTPTTSPTVNGPLSPEDQVLAAINRARAGQGLPPLTRGDGLSATAKAHTQAMAHGCGLQGICPGEPELAQRLSAAGVKWTTLAENLGQCSCSGTSTSNIAARAVAITENMLASGPPDDGNRQNILSTSFRHVGISVLRDTKGTLWMTQDFSD